MSDSGIRFSTQNRQSGVDFSELHFHKVDQKLIYDLPLQLEYQIRNVLTVIKEAIEKFKISLILPQIFENPKILHKYLKNTEYENCLKLVNEYRDERKCDALDEPPKTSYNLIKIIDYFHENFKILEVLPNWLDDIDITEKTLLKAFEDLYQVTKERFHRPAVADLAKEKRLHEVYLANETLKNSISELTHKLQNKKINYLWKFAAKGGAIKKLEDELAFHQYDNNILVNREIAKRNQEIRQINSACIANQCELEEEFEKTRIQYEQTLKEDLIQEKNARDEKNKLQLQLQALISKYDQTIFAKYEEEIFLQEEYERQKREFDEFMIEYNRESTIYDEKVLKKEEEYKRLRAAKKIQHWWKTYLCEQKKIQKRMAKARKGRKGKANGGAAALVKKSGGKGKEVTQRK